MKEQIAIFDYKVIRTNPIGQCHLRMLERLSAHYDFTVFAVEFDNPNPERIRWVRIPAPVRPLAALYIVFHLVAPLVYLWHRLRHRVRFDLVQMVESDLLFGDIAYVHFCHRYFLRQHFRHGRPRGMRGWLRWLDHRMHALVEPWVFRRVKRVVVPSRGLRRELITEYPWVAKKVMLVANPVDLDRMARPADFPREQFRAGLDVTPDQFLMVFAALGHFERKGLDVLLESMVQLPAELFLIVVGGETDLLAIYRERVRAAGLADRVKFVGMQSDVRPYLWSADAFILPSAYEVFPLVALEAAAAGVPIVTTALNGVEEYLKDAINGFLIDRTPAGVSSGLHRLLALSPEARAAIAQQAKSDVQRYGVDQFAAAWRGSYQNAGVSQ